MPIQSKACRLSQYKQLAASPDTSPEQLRELAAISSKPISERVAANPNTPIDVLWKLGAKFPKQLLENPVLPLLLLENPNFVEDIPLNTLISILKQEQIPEYILNSASKHQDEEVLILVASNINTCKTALEHLATSRYSKVEEIAKLHVNLVGEIQSGWEDIARQAMINFNSEKVYEFNQEDLAIAQLIPDYLFPALLNNILRIIASHPDTPVHVLEMLSENSFDCRVHESVVSNLNTPVTLLESVAKYYNQKFGKILCINFPNHYCIEQVFSAIAKNPNTPIDILEEFYQISSHSILRAIAENPNAPVELLDLLTEHKHTYIRSSVAKNPNTSINSLKKLCVDRDEWIRLNVTENINLPANLIDILARDKEMKIRLYVANHPNISKRALELLAQDESEWVRCNVAKNPKTTINLLSVLAKEKGHSVRYYVAGNSNAPTNLLKTLAQDEHFLVRQAVASNPNTPLYILKKLSKDEHLKVHLGLATNPNNPQQIINVNLIQEFPLLLAENSVTPASVLTALAKHSNRAVRMSVARNKSTPEEALEILAKDKKHEVRHIAAKNPNMCKEKFAKITLERIAKSAPSFSRFIVFLHPQVPQEALIKNYRSPLWLERYAIAQNPNTPKHIVSELTSDANQIVRAAASSAIKHIM